MANNQERKQQAQARERLQDWVEEQNDARDDALVADEARNAPQPPRFFQREGAPPRPLQRIRGGLLQEEDDVVPRNPAR